MSDFGQLNDLNVAANDLLRQGLAADEGKDYRVAIDRYTQALELLQAGAGIDITGIRSKDRSIAAAIQEKMKGYLANFGDRLRVVQELAQQREPNKPGWTDRIRSIFGRANLNSRELAFDAVPNLSEHYGHNLGPPLSLQPTKQIPHATAQRPSHSGPTLNSRGGQTFSKAPPLKTAKLNPSSGSTPVPNSNSAAAPGSVMQQLQRVGIEARLLPPIIATIVSDCSRIQWADVVGLSTAKQAIFEAVVLPLQRPDLFTGLRSPPRGILLFGPPGTGKTFLAKACASTCKATFFNVSASSMTSKWVGEGEKLVKALFQTANALSPSIVFVDEIDSLLTARSEHENESSRRLKTEFMIQMEGLGTNQSAQVLVLAATNRPFDLDDAVLRRFPKRLFIPLPDAETRELLLRKLVQSECKLSDSDYRTLVKATAGFSSSDLTHLCKEAVMVPLRELGSAAATIPADKVRKAGFRDFELCLRTIKPTTNSASLAQLAKWDKEYGSAAS